MTRQKWCIVQLKLVERFLSDSLKSKLNDSLIIAAKLQKENKEDEKSTKSLKSMGAEWGLSALS